MSKAEYKKTLCRLALELINLLLEFQNVEATYRVLQPDDQWMCAKCYFKQILCLAWINQSIVTCAVDGSRSLGYLEMQCYRAMLEGKSVDASQALNYCKHMNNYQDRRRKWIFGGLKIKRLSSLTTPSSLNERSLGEAEEELIKNALTVAHAATAAAEEAITTALVDAEIVQFTSTPQHIEEDRRRKWIFGGLKIKRLSSLTTPSSLNERSLGEAEEELIKNALTVAHAATAAAEEAITTALVDAEIVQFTSTPQYNHQCVNELEVFSVIRLQGEAPQCNYQCMREIHEFAATRIQSAFSSLPCEFKEDGKYFITMSINITVSLKCAPTKY
ncbi:uncharacterized protein LOC142616910 [Castanea sativa]|uniref:uncharacterized protein LOC142616910 n=1 Tax=Castanea sativa TaxID=21020 RepID=UPI003F64FCAC